MKSRPDQPSALGLAAAGHRPPLVNPWYFLPSLPIGYGGTGYGARRLRLRRCARHMSQQHIVTAESPLSAGNRKSNAKTKTPSSPSKNLFALSCFDVARDFIDRTPYSVCTLPVPL